MVLAVAESHEHGITEVFRAMKYLPSGITSFNANVQDLLRKKVFDTMKMTSCLDSYIVNSMLRHCSYLYKLRNSMLTQSRQSMNMHTLATQA